MCGAHLSSEVTRISPGHGHGTFPSGDLNSSPRRLLSHHPRLQPMGPAQSRWAVSIYPPRGGDQTGLTLGGSCLGARGTSHVSQS